jgi:hypothetical protein
MKSSKVIIIASVLFGILTAGIATSLLWPLINFHYMCRVPAQSMPDEIAGYRKLTGLEIDAELMAKKGISYNDIVEHYTDRINSQKGIYWRGSLDLFTDPPTGGGYYEIQNDRICMTYTNHSNRTNIVRYIYKNKINKYFYIDETGEKMLSEEFIIIFN